MFQHSAPLATLTLGCRGVMNTERLWVHGTVCCFVVVILAEGWIRYAVPRRTRGGLVAWQSWGDLGVCMLAGEGTHRHARHGLARLLLG